MKTRMKNFKKLLLIAVFTIGLGSVANAQKVGHIDFEKLISEMPETKTLSADAEKLAKTYQTEIEELGKKLQAKMEKYRAEGATQTETTNKQRGQEIQQDQARYEQARQAAMQDMQKRQAEGLNPIIEKAQKAIQDVAAEKGIEYVLDASIGKGLLVKKGTDLFVAVKAKLGF